MNGRGAPRRRDGVLVHPEGDEVRLRDARADRDHVLNPTAFAIWELCDGATSVDEMVDSVCDLFAIDADVARLDLENVLVDLVLAGLIDVVPHEREVQR